MATLDDTVDHGKPQAGAFADLLGGKEGVEDPLPDFRENTLAGIFDQQLHKGPWLQIRLGDEIVWGENFFSTEMVSVPPLASMAWKALVARFMTIW